MTSNDVRDSILDVDDFSTLEEFYIGVDNVQSTSLITPYLGLIHYLDPHFY